MTARVAFVLGTRPEAVKLGELVRLAGRDRLVVHTGQHYDRTMASGVLDALGFPEPDVVLGVGGTTRGVQIGRATACLDEVFAEARPSVVVVQGDTNATVAGGLAANAHEIPLVHVEAGLRSHDRAMPEEHNRVVVDHLADLCCAPTDVAAANLRAEAIDEGRIAVTGNTVVDALARIRPSAADRLAASRTAGVEPDRFVLATIHRPENVDRAEPLTAVLQGLGRLGLPVVVPLHPRTRARAEAFGLTGLLEQLVVVEPMDPVAFLALGSAAALWVTDSGGLQEEASVLKKPVVVVRRSTERPEVLGTFADLVPPSGLLDAARAWLDDPGRAAELRAIPSPYGEGDAAERIMAEIRARFLSGPAAP